MIRHRVFTYITRDDQLLVLKHPDPRYVDPQIPGGTVKEGERPAVAALREAQEETGLGSLYLVRLLGSFERCLADIGRDETIMAWFFHLATKERTPNAWRHMEEDPSEGDGPIEFELYWAPLDSLPKLGGIDEAMLAQLRVSLNQEDSTPEQ